MRKANLYSPIYEERRKEIISDNMKIGKKVLMRLLSWLVVLFVVLSLMILSNKPPINGYEISIYDVYPTYLWIFLGATLFFSECIFLLKLFSNDRSKLWLIAFLSMIMVNSILCFMPLIRGYFFYGKGDALTHVFFVRQIIERGRIGVDVYPAGHLMAAFFSKVLHISPFLAVNIVPPLFYLFYIFSIYLFSKKFFKDEKELILALMILTLPIQSSISTIFVPNALSFFMIPIIFYTIFSNNLQFLRKTLILFIFILTLFLYHSVTAAYTCILIFIVVIVMAIFSDKTDISISFVNTKILYKLLFLVSIVIGIGILMMYFLSPQFFSYILFKFTTLFNSVPQSKVYGELVKRAKPTIFDILKIFLLKFGQLITILLYSLFLFLLIIYNKKKKHYTFGCRLIFLLVGIMFFVMVGLFSFFGKFLLSFSRTFKFLLFLLPLFIASSWKYTMYFSGKVKLFCIITFVFFVTVLIFFSLWTALPSPLSKIENQQETQMSLKGASWFFEKNGGLKTFELSPLHREYDALGRRGVLRLDKNVNPPNHFTYDHNQFFGEMYKEDRYLSICAQSRIYSPKIWPEFRDRWKYDPEDFKKLEIDYTVNKIYFNGDVEFYYIKTGQ